MRRRSAGDRKRRPVELTVTHETVSDADAGVSTPPRRNSFQVMSEIHRLQFTLCLTC